MPGRGPIPPGRRRIFRFWLPLRIARGHPRLFAGMAASLLAGVLLPDSFRLATRLLIAWNVGTWLYFIASGIMIARATPQSMRRRARMSDEGRFFILVFTSLAALAAIAAIVAELAAVNDLSGTIKGLHIGLAAATIVSAWFFIHLTYALHYAHEYFDEYFAEPGRPAAERGGLALRRVALVHCVLAFFFNSAVLALTINIGAGLI